MNMATGDWKQADWSSSRGKLSTFAPKFFASAATWRVPPVKSAALSRENIPASAAAEPPRRLESQAKTGTSKFPTNDTASDYHLHILGNQAF